jgi:hypothetical protein
VLHLNRKIKTHLYKSLILPILLYGASARGYAAKSTTQKLQVIQNKILWSIYDEDIYTSNTSIHIELGVGFLNDVIKRGTAKLYQRIRQHNPIIAPLGNYDIHMHYLYTRSKHILH